MLPSRRVYISSVDNTNPDPKFSKIDIDLSGARIGRDSGQRLSLALVRASFPAETGAMPITSVISTDINAAISVLAFSYSTDGVTFGTKQRIYYNQTSTTLNSGTNNHNGYWCLNTSLDQILAQINLICGTGSDLKVDSFGRLTMGTAVLAIGFYFDDTSLKIMNAFGLKRNLPPGSGESPIITSGVNVPDRNPVSLASVLPAIYITTQNNMGSFSSAKGGTSINILGSVPVSLDTTAIGNDTLVTTIDGVQQVSTPSTQLNYTNHNVHGSHKSIDDKDVSHMVFSLLNDELKHIGTMGKEWNMTIDIKTINAPN
jgi:hypothetical protein